MPLAGAPGAGDIPEVLGAAIAAVRALIGAGERVLADGTWPLIELGRQTVLLALARRAVVTATAVTALTERGLAEPALATVRTLLEVQMRAVNIVADPTDNAARFQVAWSYAHARNTQKALLSDQAAAAELGPANRERAHAMIAEIDAALAMPAFDAVRDRVNARRSKWHGDGDLLQACRKLGITADYLQLYGPASAYVHGAEPDRDVTEHDDGRRSLRPIADVAQPLLVGATLAAAYHLRPVLQMALTGERVFYTEVVIPGPAWSLRVSHDVLAIESAFADVVAIAMHLEDGDAPPSA